MQRLCLPREHGEAQSDSVGKCVSAKCQFHMTRDHFECGISGDQTCE
jgi:hypothetical protein